MVGRAPDRRLKLSDRLESKGLESCWRSTAAASVAFSHFNFAVFKP
jgi:hypothetical protein